MQQGAQGIVRYLERHAEDEAHLAPALTTRHGHVLCVPAYDEGDSFLRLLASVTPGPMGTTLVVAVVNARDDSPEDVVERNRLLLSRLRLTFRDSKPLGQHAVVHATPFGELLCIDRNARERLPARRGVGLARKIAADVALGLHAQGTVASPWIHLTDADAVLPRDYFARTASLTTLGQPRQPGQPERERSGRARPFAAAIYPFRHSSKDRSLQRAGALHEMFMRHYVIGLASAGSPYAYHSIGSLIAVAASAYASVRGVPRRHGAEDFYLLNKLAKLGPIARLQGEAIELEARASERVPFGTGPSIRRWLTADATLRPFYHADCFRCLAALLGVLEPALRGDSPRDGATLLLQEARRRGLDGALIEALIDEVQLERLLHDSMSRSPAPETRLRDFHTRFDALRTLQLMHALRDRALPSTDWQTAMAALGLANPLDPAAALAELVDLERQRCGAACGLGSRGPSPPTLRRVGSSRDPGLG